MSLMIGNLFSTPYHTKSTFYGGYVYVQCQTGIVCLLSFSAFVSASNNNRPAKVSSNSPKYHFRLSTGTKLLRAAVYGSEDNGEFI